MHTFYTRISALHHRKRKTSRRSSALSFALWTLRYVFKGPPNYKNIYGSISATPSPPLDKLNLFGCTALRMGPAILANFAVRKHVRRIESNRISSFRAARNSMAIPATRFSGKELYYTSASTDGSTKISSSQSFKTCTGFYRVPTFHTDRVSRQGEFDKARALWFWSHTLATSAYYSQPRHVFKNDCFFTATRFYRDAFRVENLPAVFTSDHLRVMLKLMKSLRHLFVGAGMVHRDRKSLLSIESASLLTLGLDGLSTLRMQCLRCNTPNLKEFQLANCLDLTAAFVYSKSLESMCLRNLSSFHNLKSTSTRLSHVELVACPAMPITTLRIFLREHQTIKRLSIIGELTGLTLYGCMCPHLKVLNILLCQVPRLGSIKIDCPTLEYFLCDVYRRGPVIADEFTGLPHDRSTCSIFIRSRKLERVSINLPNATAIGVKCDELKHLSVTMGETASDRKAPLDFEVIADAVSFIRTTNCKFSRYHLQSTRIGKIAVQLCEMESKESIPRLDIHTRAVDKLVFDNCHRLECAELRVKPNRTARHVLFSECNNLQNIVMSRAVKCPPEISIAKCRNLQSILVSSGRQIDFSTVKVTGCPSLNIPRPQQNCKEELLVGEDNGTMAIAAQKDEVEIRV